MFVLWTPPFVDGSGNLIPAAFLNHVRLSIGKSLDAVGGSEGVPYTPLTPIEFGGAGWVFDCPVIMTDLRNVTANGIISFALDPTDVFGRIYGNRGLDHGLEMVVNAHLDTANDWEQDAVGQPSAMKLSVDYAGKVIISRQTSLGSPWADTAWGDVMQIQPGIAPTVAEPNTLYSLNIPKVIGKVSSDGAGGTTIPAGDFLNVSAVVISSDEFLVTMDVAMADTHYVVLPTLESVTGDGSHAVGRPVSTTQFRVRVQNSSGVVTLSNIARTVGFVVFGKQ